MVNPEKIAKYFKEYTGCSEELIDFVNLHISLLLKWQKIANLIGLQDEKEIAELLYIDSFMAINKACEFLLAENISIEEISDIGSGAGFPSIFWPHFLPHKVVKFYEAKRKKANFLREFIRLSNLMNCMVIEQMVRRESIRTDLIISKAAINVYDWPYFGISNVKRGGVVISLLTDETLPVYNKAVERTGKIARSEVLKYILPVSRRNRFLGILIKR